MLIKTNPIYIYINIKIIEIHVWVLIRYLYGCAVLHKRRATRVFHVCGPVG